MDDALITLDMAKLQRQLEKAKAKLFLLPGAGFLGSLVCNHNFIWDPGCGTAWTDGDTIGIDPFFWSILTPGNQIFVNYHEVWHTGYDHMGRRGNRCPDKWNIAADYVINNQADHAGLEIKTLPIKIYMDHKYDGMTTEQIYDLLDKNPGLPQPEYGQGSGTFQGDVRPNPSPNAKTVIQKVIQARQVSQMSKEVGAIPGEIEEAIDEFLNPVLPWPIIVSRFMTAMDASDYSWKRPSRRYDEEYLPSIYSENGLEHLLYGWDISGSMGTDDLVRVNSETKSVHDDLGPKKMTVVTFDTEIHDIFEFGDDETFEKIVVHGRGGTNMEPLMQYALKHKPTAVVVFSDMYCNWNVTNPGVPVLWIAIDNKDFKPPFGTVHHIKKDQI